MKAFLAMLTFSLVSEAHSFYKSDTTMVDFNFGDNGYKAINQVAASSLGTSSLSPFGKFIELDSNNLLVPFNTSATSSVIYKVSKDGATTSTFATLKYNSIDYELRDIRKGTNAVYLLVDTVVGEDTVGAGNERVLVLNLDGTLKQTITPNTVGNSSSKQIVSLCVAPDDSSLFTFLADSAANGVIEKWNNTTGTFTRDTSFAVSGSFPVTTGRYVFDSIYLKDFSVENVSTPQDLVIFSVQTTSASTILFGMEGKNSTTNVFSTSAPTNTAITSLYSINNKVYGAGPAISSGTLNLGSTNALRNQHTNADSIALHEISIINSLAAYTFNFQKTYKKDLKNIYGDYLNDPIGDADVLSVSSIYPIKTNNAVTGWLIRLDADLNVALGNYSTTTYNSIQQKKIDYVEVTSTGEFQGFLPSGTTTATVGKGGAFVDGDYLYMQSDRQSPSNPLVTESVIIRAPSQQKLSRSLMNSLTGTSSSTYTKTETDNLLKTKANSTDVITALSFKADKKDVANKFVSIVKGPVATWEPTATNIKDVADCIDEAKPDVAFRTVNDGDKTINTANFDKFEADKAALGANDIRKSDVLGFFEGALGHSSTKSGAAAGLDAHLDPVTNEKVGFFKTLGEIYNILDKKADK